MFYKLMFKNKLWLKFLVVFCVFPMAFGSKPLDRIVATIGGEIITNQELQSKINLVTNSLKTQNIPLPAAKILEKQVLEKMILDEIQLQMAKSFAIEVDSNTLNEAIADLSKNQHLTIEQYKKQIEQEGGIAFKDFKEQLKNEIIISRLQHRELLNEIRVSAAEIDSYINSPAGQDHSSTEYRLGHILISAPENPTPEDLKELDRKAAMIMQEIKQGKNFKEVAASYSSGQQALEGGDLGWRKMSEIPTVFVKSVIGMQVNDVVGPIKTPSGLHIIKLQDQRSDQKVVYEFKVRQILISLKNNKNEQQLVTDLINIRKRITENGEDFAKLAASKSEEASTAVKGGDLGWIRKDAVLPIFWEQINKLKVGEISDPFKTDLGWHLVKIEGKRNVANNKDRSRERAAEILREQKFNEALESWLKKIRHQAKVEIFYN